jgi:hypothetical protein
MVLGRCYKYLCFLLLAGSLSLYCQTDKLNQFWNEYAFTKDLSAKWALELNLGLTTSSIAEDADIFHNLIQVYVRGWAHYSPAERWKISVFYAYFFNKNVPELSQREAPEFRTALQVLYRLVWEDRTKVNLRARFEDRHLHNEDGFFESVERFRFQARAIYPFNGTEIKKNIVYVFISDEVFFKTKSKVSGPDVFDRNRVTLGIGYFITDDIQLEASYANEIMPREQTDQLVNAFQLNIVFNNLVPNLIKSFTPKKPVLE